MDNPSKASRLGLLGLLVLLLATACARRNSGSPPSVVESGSVPVDSGVSLETLRLNLSQFANLAETTLRETTTLLANRAKTRDARKAALLWNANVVKGLRATTEEDDPVVALIDTWALVVRMRLYLEQGEGSRIFGPDQPVALKTARTLETRVEAIAEKTFGTGQYRDIEKRIETFCEANPMTGLFSTAGTTPYFSVEKPGVDTLSYIASLPMMPVRAITSISGAPGSIRDIAGTADRFTDVVEALPEDTRIQMELFLLSLEENDMATSTVRNFQQVTDNSTRLIDVAERLPGEVGAETRSVLADVEKRQPALSLLLNDTRDTLAEARQTTLAAKEALDSAAEAAQAIEGAADAVGSATRDIAALAHPEGEGTREVDGTDPTDPTDRMNGAGRAKKGPPFDINDYTRAAQALTTGTQELRRLLADVRDFTGSGELTSRIAETQRQARGLIGESGTQARSLIDHASLRAAQLLGLVFALAVLYRVLARRVGVARKD